MTLTAMRPDPGLSKGREVSLFSVAQAEAFCQAKFRIVPFIPGEIGLQVEQN